MLTRSGPSELTLEITPSAWERCFMVADILAEEYGKADVEYGLIALADVARPLRVIETVLLTGQSVDKSSVYQSGRNVMNMRREIAELSQKRARSLIPASFVHRHPGICTPSKIDEEFLRGTLVNQCATLQTVLEPTDAFDDGVCEQCLASLNHGTDHILSESKESAAVEYAVAHSLIVNREREFSIRAAVKVFCRLCDKGQVYDVPTSVKIWPNRQLTANERRQMRRELTCEISEKIQFVSQLSVPDSVPDE